LNPRRPQRGRRKQFNRSGRRHNPALTKACIEFCRALNLTRFDVMGFSLGGMIAQRQCHGKGGAFQFGR
jgi:pimeloyl-ACP methyl ester carboxylesterase